MSPKYPKVLNDTLTVTSAMSLWLAYPLVSTVKASSTFTCEVVKCVPNLLDLVSTFTYKKIQTLTLVDTPDIQSDFSAIVLDPTYIGSRLPDIDATPSPISPGNILTPLSFSLYYPPGSLRMTLPAPQLGDTEHYTQIRNVEYSRGKTLLMFRNSAWGEEGIFEWTFTYLTESEKDTLLNLLHESLGKHVQTVDHLGISRIGFIITPETDVAQPVINGWTVTFQFQAELNL